MNCHEGHFERLREKFRKGALADHELIELLLHNVQTRVNTNETAHSMIEQSGGFCEMFSVSEEALCKIKGVGEKSALLVRNVAEISH